MKQNPANEIVEFVSICLSLSLCLFIVSCKSNSSGPENQASSSGEALSAPMVSISGITNEGNYSVTWSLISSATAYELQEDQNSNFSSNYTIYSGSNLSMTFQGKAIGTIFYYRVRAVNSLRASPWSEVKAIQIPQSALNVPTLSIGALTSEGYYSVSWNSITGAITYELQEDQTQSFASNLSIYSGSGISYVIRNKPFNKIYYYRVRASNGSSTSSWSTAKSVQTMVPSVSGTWVPTNFTGMTIIISSSGTSLSVTGSVVGTGYRQNLTAGPIQWTRTFPFSGGGTYSCPNFSITSMLTINGSVIHRDTLLVTANGTLYDKDAYDNYSYSTSVNISSAKFVRK